MREIKDEKICCIPVASQCNSSPLGVVADKVTYSTAEYVLMGTPISPHLGFLHQIDMDAVKTPLPAPPFFFFFFYLTYFGSIYVIFVFYIKLY